MHLIPIEVFTRLSSIIGSEWSLDKLTALAVALMFWPFYGTGDLLMLLNVSSDEAVLPTTYGELRPPLGKHRLKVNCSRIFHNPYFIPVITL